MAAPAVASPPPAAIQDQTVVVEPGTVVLAVDGSELGRLEGSRTNMDGVAEVVVRDADGQMRAVPTTAVTLRDDGLYATWTAAQFRSAPVLIPTAGPAVGATGADGPHPDASQLRTGTHLDTRLGETLLEDPVRRTEVDQQQAPGEFPR